MPIHTGTAGGVDNPPDPGPIPDLETSVAVSSTGSAASYAIQFSGEIIGSNQLESDDQKLSAREAEGTVTSGDTDSWTGRAGVVRVANAGSSAGAIEVALQGETHLVNPGEVLALRFVPGPMEPLVLPEDVFGVPSDVALGGGAAVGVGAAAMLLF